MKTEANYPRSCAEIKLGNASAATGVYWIRLRLSPKQPCSEGNPNCAFQVYCDMDSFGGGWTVFQRRYDGSEDFVAKKWNDYVGGFGSVDKEHWLGLWKTLALTTESSQELLVSLAQKQQAGCRLWAKYANFRLDNAWNYKLRFASFVGGTASAFYA